MPVIFGIEIADLIWPAVIVGGGYVAYSTVSGVAQGAQQGAHDAAQNVTSNISTLLLIGAAALLLVAMVKQ